MTSSIQESIYGNIGGGDWWLGKSGETMWNQAKETMNQALKEGWKSDSLSHMQVLCGDGTWHFGLGTKLDEGCEIAKLTYTLVS